VSLRTTFRASLPAKTRSRSAIKTNYYPNWTMGVWHRARFTGSSPTCCFGSTSCLVLVTGEPPRGLKAQGVAIETVRFPLHPLAACVAHLTQRAGAWYHLPPVHPHPDGL
ncbi:hypothetical protein GOODEAATRI_003319, partial [Goodea atripinnis]